MRHPYLWGHMRHCDGFMAQGAAMEHLDPPMGRGLISKRDGNLQGLRDLVLIKELPHRLQNKPM